MKKKLWIIAVVAILIVAVLASLAACGGNRAAGDATPAATSCFNTTEVRHFQPVDAETATMVRNLSTLTPQQVRVLMMLSEGLLNKQIAYELGVSEATVKAHVSAILTKLDVDSRTQAVIAASKIAGTAWATAGASATA